MSIRVFKSTLKRLNAADRDAKALVDSAHEEDRELGQPGASTLHDYAFDALAYAYGLHVRARKVQRRLRPNVLAAVKLAA